MPDTTTRAREIRAELDKLAPLRADNDVTAVNLALYCAKEAQLAWARMMSMDHPITGTDIAIAQGYFAATHALMVAAGVDATEANKAAAEIRGAWTDGGGVGEWLWDHLDTRAEQITALADELVKATPKPASGPWGPLTQDDLYVILTTKGVLPDDVYDRLRTAALMPR